MIFFNNFGFKGVCCKWLFRKLVVRTMSFHLEVPDSIHQVLSSSDVSFNLKIEMAISIQVKMTLSWHSCTQ